MRILILSKYFYPNVGGLEAIAWICLREFSRQGHEVRLVTESDGRIDEEEKFSIFRQTSLKQLKNHLQWSDVVFHNDAAARYLWPLLRSGKPYLVYMSGYVYPGCDGLPGRTTLKRLILTQIFAILLAKARRNLAACAAVSAANRVPAQIVPNPFDNAKFQTKGNMVRDHDFLFAGRIVSLKGLDDLINALAILRDQYTLKPNLTIAGPGITAEGVAESAYGNEILQLAKKLNVDHQLQIVGPQDKFGMSRLLQTHRGFIIPSKWNEPIGIVALEAIASGCVVLGSNGGGLGVTIGPCGVTFPNGNPHALAQCMADFLSGRIDLNHHLAQATAHLQRYLPETVCTQYLEALAKCISAT